MTPELHTSRLSFFGRLADDLTRRPLSSSEMVVTVEEDARPPLCKDDGHFAVVDLPPSASDYHLRLGGSSFQTRKVAKALPTLTPVEVRFEGEDELYLHLVAAPTPQNRITFETIPFVPPIEKGASVVGEGGFTATLAEPLEGRDATTAVLSGTGGLAIGQLVRIVRSPNLLLRRAPYYDFPTSLTVVAFRIVENDPAEPPIQGAKVEVTQVNGSAPVVVSVGALSLRRFALPGLSRLVLDDGARFAESGERGDAVLVFPGEKSISSIDVSVSKPQYTTTTVNVSITVKSRNFQKVSLTHV